MEIEGAAPSRRAGGGGSLRLIRCVSFSLILRLIHPAHRPSPHTTGPPRAGKSAARGTHTPHDVTARRGVGRGARERLLVPA